MSFPTKIEKDLTFQNSWGRTKTIVAGNVPQPFCICRRRVQQARQKNADQCNDGVPIGRAGLSMGFSPSEKNGMVSLQRHFFEKMPPKKETYPNYKPRVERRVELTNPHAVSKD